MYAPTRDTAAKRTERDTTMSLTTGEVLNESAELVDYNLFSSHSALEEAGVDCDALMARVLAP